jgi:hypothetical protein
MAHRRVLYIEGMAFSFLGVVQTTEEAEENQAAAKTSYYFARYWSALNMMFFFAAEIKYFVGCKCSKYFSLACVLVPSS